MILKNEYLGKSSHDIMKEEIELKEQVKRRINKIEELKEDVKGGSKAAKMLRDLEYEKTDEIAAIADKIWNI